jgi:hypothetical protein
MTGREGAARNTRGGLAPQPNLVDPFWRTISLCLDEGRYHDGTGETTASASPAGGKKQL